MEKPLKIAVLTSGGVDSSLATSLLKQEGHDLTAFYLKIWLEDELSSLGNCPWNEDLEYVRQLCQNLDIPLKEISLQKEYWDSIVNYTISEAKAGRTPNPDIFCNSRIKFGCFLDHIDDSFEKIATGHYAQVAKNDQSYQLKCSPDKVKDQTYFLAHLSQEQLSKVIFPIGHLTKDEVRKLAAEHNIPAKDRKDSQGLCFLGKLKFSEFLKFHLGEQKGDFIEFESGKKIGEHNGFWFYTVGQRKGMGLSGGPWYVVKKDIDKNVVFISRAYHEPDKVRDTVLLENFHWINQEPKTSDLKVKLRHGPEFYQCNLKLEGNFGQAKLSGQDQGIAPGQFAVFYDDQICLGCAMIGQTDSLSF